MKKINGEWNSIQQITANADMEYGVSAEYTADGIPMAVWMRDSSVVGSFGARSESQEVWLTNIGMGFFNNTFSVGNDTMALVWNEGTSLVLSRSSVVNRLWSKPKFVQLTTNIQRAASAVFESNGTLHLGFQESPYTIQSNQFSDSGSLQLISIEKVSTPLGIETKNVQAPRQFTLFNAYPNPFNPSTIIKFVLVKQAHTVVTVVNILGIEVARFADEVLNEGEHSYQFNAEHLASGVYFVRLQSGSNIEIKKMMLIK